MKNIIFAILGAIAGAGLAIIIIASMGWITTTNQMNEIERTHAEELDTEFWDGYDKGFDDGMGMADIWHLGGSWDDVEAFIESNQW